MLWRYSLRVVLFKSNRTLKRCSPAGGIWVIKNGPHNGNVRQGLSLFNSIMCSSPGWTVLQQAQKQLVLLFTDGKLQIWAQINLSPCQLIIFLGFCCCNWQMTDSKHTVRNCRGQCNTEDLCHRKSKVMTTSPVNFPFGWRVRYGLWIVIN